MPSLFAALGAAASATVDAVYAEGFRILPREAPAIAAPILANGRPDYNARRQTSAVRAGRDFQGVFVAPGATIHARGRGMADSTTRPIVVDHPMIDVDVGALREHPQRGDIIERTDTGERFEVTDPWKPVDFGRAQIWLTEA